jgi:hypothetical protein
VAGNRQEHLEQAGTPQGGLAIFRMQVETASLIACGRRRVGFVNVEAPAVPMQQADEKLAAVGLTASQLPVLAALKDGAMLTQKKPRPKASLLRRRSRPQRQDDR